MKVRSYMRNGKRVRSHTRGSGVRGKSMQVGGFRRGGLYVQPHKRNAAHAAERNRALPDLDKFLSELRKRLTVRKHRRGRFSVREHRR